MSNPSHATAPCPARPSVLAVPTLRRRVLCVIYEALILFGVLFITGYLFSTLTQQRSALMYRHALQVWLFLVLGAYFTWFWRHGGQTLPMKTWKIRVVDADLHTLSLPRAILRYCLCWLWFLPGMALDWLLGIKDWSSVGIASAWAILWACTMFIDRDRQFLHDRLAGTRLVSVIDAPSPPKAA